MFTTEETRANAQGVLDYIHEHPEQHDQRYFFCETTMCIAGTALHQKYGVCNNIQVSKMFPDLMLLTDAAGELLGLESEAERDWLFYEMDNEAAIQKLKHLVVGDLPESVV